jgi:beta-phosphoglucomutase-like phosphatase (HAD superfamily)
MEHGAYAQGERILFRLLLPGRVVRNQDHIMLRALIFDVDGTLADTERDGHRIAFNRAFADAGLDWHWDVAGYGELLRVAGGRERIRHFIDTHAAHIPVHERDALARALHARKTEHYLRMVYEGAVQLRRGVARLLAEAHATGLTLAIATTTSRANIDVLLAHALPPGALEWFCVIGAAEDAPRKKPDPQVYEFVLDQLQLAPHECLALEDSAAGLRAALAAGIPTVITANDYTREQDFSGALAVLTDFGESSDPALVLAGPDAQHGFVDVAQLIRWHASDRAIRTGSA